MPNLCWQGIDPIDPTELQHMRGATGEMGQQVRLRMDTCKYRRGNPPVAGDSQHSSFP